jgi:hypothetical protein
MDKELKVVLAIIAIALVLCVGASVGIWLVARQFITPLSTTDPAQAAKIGHQIAGYTLPPGYREQYASNAYGYKVVVIGAQSGMTNAMTIVLAEFPGWFNIGQKELLGQLEQPEEDDNDLGLRTVSTQTVNIRGRPVAFKLSESTEQSGGGLCQVSGTFPSWGNSTIMVVATGMNDAWDPAALDSFLASIK